MTPKRFPNISPSITEKPGTASDKARHHFLFEMALKTAHFGIGPVKS
jgi:hypothetical protein